MYILGIDPGSRFTGYGVISLANNNYSYIDCGVINVIKEDEFIRLAKIHQAVTNLIQKYNINFASIEKVFVANNPNSALKLGQARGAILSALALNNIGITEYAPKVIKKAVVGNGGAQKAQVQLMIRYLLKLNFMPQEDAADALAIAICGAMNINMNMSNVSP